MVRQSGKAGALGAAGGDALRCERAGLPGFMASEAGEDGRKGRDLPVTAPVAFRDLGGEHPDTADIARPGTVSASNTASVTSAMTPRLHSSNCPSGTDAATL